MKKRNRARGRRNRSTQQNFFQAFVDRARRGRKAWTFERLEDRFFLSVTPLDTLDLQPQSFSSATPQGAAAIAARELSWYNQLAVNSGSGATAVQSLSLPNDPYFQYQWNFLNTGQIVNDYQDNPTLQPIYGVAGNDINVAPVWDMGITGTGVLVAVNDVGVQLNHPDLAGNISPTWQLDVQGGDSNPSPGGTGAGDAHGTEVAGLIAAIQNNGIGTTGAAPGAKIAPVRLLPTGGIGNLSDTQIANALILNGAPLDVSNNSWGPNDGPTGTNRAVAGPGLLTQQALQELATQGRDGKGTVIVFASGNNAGPINSPGFQSFGNWSSAGSNGYNNSRYTISVGAVDHDGGLNNSDGTQTLYSEAGPSTLVVAPSGSASIDIGGNTGTGSGIYTTDLTNGGANTPPLGNGLEVDGDFFPDTNYASRFNGTSAAAPEVSAIVALMLQANPDLTFRDVEEILVRSARQNDPTDTSWIVNGNPLFRDPVPMLYNGTDAAGPGMNPLLDPQTPGHTAPDPLYTNGAGYTVSQGRTPLAGEYGYGHGEVDALLAVQLAKQWTVKSQTLAPELTWTTFVQNGDRKIRGAQKSNDDSGDVLLPGSIVGTGTTKGFADYFDEFYADMPFSGDTPPVDLRGTYIPIDVPTTSQGKNNLMDIEWVEVKLDLRYSNANDLDGLRIALQSPDGTISDLTNYQIFNVLPASFQTLPPNFNLLVDPPGVLDDNADGNSVFSWIYSTNRDWGERSDTEPVVDPTTGKQVTPLINDVGNGDLVGAKPWELHFENYSSTDIILAAYEVVFHGHPIGTGTEPVERVLGKVGVDSGVAGVTGTRNDGNFNFDRDPTMNQEPFGSNVTVTATPTGLNGTLTTAGAISGKLTSAGTTTQLVDSLLIGAALQPQVGDTVKITDGPDKDSVRKIVAYDGVTGTMTLDSPLASVQTIGVGFTVSRLHLIDSGLIGKANQPSVGDSITIGSQTRTVSAYDAVTGTITLDSPFTAAPAKGAKYTVAIAVQKVLAQFVTGADGNYYFDLPAGIYRFNVVDPLGRTAEAGVGNNPKYNTSWTVTVDTTDAFTRTAGGLNPATQKYEEYNQLNFLLDAGPAPVQQITTSGSVFTDLNGSGIRDAGEPAAVGFTVYVDSNKSGQKEAGEQSTTTDTDGNFSLTITADKKDTFTIGVVAPPGWTATNPNPSLHSVYGGPGDTFSDLDYGLLPPPGAVPVDPGSPGSVLGVIYNDVNLNGNRDGGEIGVSGIQVFVDVNNSGSYDVGEPTATTDSGGAFFIGNVTPGTLSVKAIVNSPYTLTQPANATRVVTLTSGGAITNVLFGVQNNATRDFGDLGGPYPTLLADNGPRNTIVPGFLLGSVIDGEVDGQPSLLANGDDAVGNDEDGIKILDSQGNPGGSIHPGDNTLQVTVQGVGGYLNGWIDWNQDGDWNDAGEQVFTNLHLNPGTYQLTVTAPAGVASGALAARFRWGSLGQSYTGADVIGETEDYRLKNSFPDGDFNRDGAVNNADYQVWVNSFGQTGSGLAADGNHNGMVDSADYSVWRDHMASSPGAGAGALSGSGDETSVSSLRVSPAQLQAYLDQLNGTGTLDPKYLAFINSWGITATAIHVGNNTRYVYSLDANNWGQAAQLGGGSVASIGLPTAGSNGATTPTVGVSGPTVSVANSLDLALMQFAPSISAQANESAFASSTDFSQSGSNKDLLLLDEALANLGVSHTFEHDDALLSLSSDSQTESHDELSDLSLAAVFDNDTDWRNAI